MRLTVAVLLATHAILAWAMRVPGLATGHDDALYIALARALRQGSYVELPIVGHPLHAMYPPLYPALLGALGVTDPAHIWLGVLANIALSVATIALLAGVALRVSPWLAVALTLVCAVNPMLLYVASGVHSEPMLAAAAAAAISVGVTKRRDARAMILLGMMAIAAALARSIGVALVVATFALLAFEKRWRALSVYVIAAALTVGSWMIWTIRAPRLDAGRSYVSDAFYDPGAPAQSAPVSPRPGAPSATRLDSAAPRAARDSAEPRAAPRSGVRVPIDSVQQRSAPDSAMSPSGADTTDLDARRAAAAHEEREAERVASARTAAGAQFVRALGLRAWRNVPAYLTRELPTVLAIPTRAGTAADNVVWLALLLATAGAGLVVLLRRAWLLVAYLALSSGILAFWPYVDKRFLAPLVPLVILAMLAGTWWLVERAVSRRAAQFASLALGALLAAVALRSDADRLARVAECDRSNANASPGCFNDEQRAFFAAVAAVDTLTPDSARFLVSKEATFYLLSGRQAVRQSAALAKRSPQALDDFLRANRVEFILLSHLHLDQWALASTLLPQCERLQLMGTFGPHVALLRLPPPVADSIAPDSTDVHPAVAVPNIALPEPPAPPADSSESMRGTDSAPAQTRDACEAIARWNSGSWDPPPVRIW